MIIFDLDGVIVDTALFHFMAWKRLAHEIDLYFDKEMNEKLKGVSRINSFKIILEMNNKLDEFSLEEIEYYINLKNTYYLQLVDTITEKNILPGVMKLLEDCKKNNILLAVASASKNALKVIEKLSIINYFDYIVDVNEIRESKPSPEIFLNCCDKFNIMPKDCIGIEDSYVGIESIKKSGMFSVGINVTYSQDSYYGADYQLVSTKELDFQKIIRAFNVKAFNKYIQI